MKIGVMGGSFNPIHMGHLMMSEYIRSELDIDKVFFIPTGKAPHKDKYVVSGEARYRMVDLACRDNPHFHPLDIEVKNPQISYSVDTINYLKEAYPEDDFYFFLGSDILKDLKSWKKFDQLAELTKFAVAIRPGFERITIEEVHEEISYLKETFGAQVSLLETPRFEISSTDLRDRLAKDKSVRYLIPDPIILYIQEKGFYKEETQNE
ncbi:MAG: nicotinate-nucleotide adenylyltransferase [Tissierellia bacterium]|nr:nicotinate-nucleotide adenylyltransferase [Tissierellia bacterium]